ncbi:MAG: ribonuclease HII [Clostridia bacterium]|nr:ribonuclease HII [Clostridia bacterium]
MMKLTYELEEKYASEGYAVICGTDEAGRGPLAGDVFAAAVILPRGLDVDGLNDSKKISEKKREKLFDIIREQAVSFGIASASPGEIDEINILNAAQLAMRRAVAMLDPAPDLVLVDGNVVRGFTVKAVPIIKGDAISPSIAAASILAKVSRDRQCLELDALYPGYGFAKHKGYPTREHMDAVRKLGPCPVHRASFLKFLDK